MSPVIDAAPRALRTLTALCRLNLNAAECYVAGTDNGLKVRWLAAAELELAPGSRWVALSLDLPAGKLGLCLQEELFNTLLQGIDPVQYWQLDAALRCACLQVYNRGALDWLNRRWQCEARVDAVALLERPPELDEALAFRLSTAAGLAYQPGLLKLDGAPQPGVLSALYETDTSCKKIAAERVPLALDVALGETRVPLAQLRALQPGDVALPEAHEFSLTTACLCLQGEPLFRADVERHSIRVTQFLRSDSMASADTPADAAPTAEVREDDAPAPPVDPDARQLDPEAIEVTLQFSLGSLTRTLAEIEQIGEGDLLQLPRQAANCVDIRVNGKCLAKGEPVLIEDRIGIRVVKITSG